MSLALSLEHRPFDLAPCVIEAVCAEWDVTAEALLGRGRPARVAEARQVAYFLLRNAGLSWHRIAKVMVRDHATGIYGAHVIVARAKHDQTLAARIRHAGESAGVLLGEKLAVVKCCGECGRPM